MAKILLSDIKKEATMLGWNLNSTNYVNLDTEMSFICPEKHEVSITYRTWREHHECPICNLSLYKPVDKIIPKGKVKHRILALDDATHNTGWSIFDDENLIKYGVFTTNYSTEVERIEALKQWLVNMIYTWQPTDVVIEDIQLQKDDFNNADTVQNLTTYKILAHLQGVLQNTLYELKVPFEVVYASVWRKAVDIKGRYRADKKKSAQLKVNQWYGLNVTDDEADAICIGRYYYKKVKPKIIKWE